MKQGHNQLFVREADPNRKFWTFFTTRSCQALNILNAFSELCPRLVFWGGGGGRHGTLANPLLRKRSSKIDHFTPLILLCLILLSHKKFHPLFAPQNFLPLLNFLSMHFQNFCWGLHVYKPSYPLFMHETTKYFIT